MKWELTGKWIISTRFGKATFRVEVKRPARSLGQDWDYKWRWANIEEIQELNLCYNGS
jgi:hypothetical protein